MEKKSAAASQPNRASHRVEHSGFIRAPEVQMLTGLSRSTIWRLEAKGQFPKRHKLSVRAAGFVRSEIMNWLSSRDGYRPTNAGESPWQLKAPANKMPGPCPDCKCKTSVWIHEPPGSVHAFRVQCSNCNRFLKWANGGQLEVAQTKGLVTKLQEHVPFDYRPLSNFSLSQKASEQFV